MKKLIKNGIEYYTFENFNKANIIHGFPTKKGGYSKGDFESLNFSYSSKDDHKNIDNNYKKFFETFDIDYYGRGKQTHSKNVKIVTKENSHIRFEDNDGLVSEDDLTLITFHADCGSVFLYDIDKDVFAMLHSGWKGTTKNIVGEAIGIMTNKFNCDTTSILVGIGPSICGKCFECDYDVAGVFLDLGYEEFVSYDSNKNKYFVNLKSILEVQALNLGILKKNIEIADECTMCNKEDFYSHRRDGLKRGGHLGFIKKNRGKNGI